ncbi:MAG: hypothetical protein WD557_04355 [Dehalococcoidia bacterium]
MTELELQLRIAAPKTAWMGMTYVVTAAIDGQPLSGRDHDIACLASFAKSLQGSGRYHLVNCSCGVRWCGGFIEGVEVEYRDGYVTLTNLDRRATGPFRIQEPSYRDAVAAALREIRAALPVQPAQMYWPCGDDVRILGLNPDVVGQSVPVQRALSPGGLFFGRKDLLSAWEEDALVRTLEAQRAADGAASAAELEPTGAEWRRVVEEHMETWWVTEHSRDPEDWYRDRERH